MRICTLFHKFSSLSYVCLIWLFFAIPIQSTNYHYLEDVDSPYPQHDFRSPLDIPLVLAGTFGELRNNHFHGGLDCKTNRQENLNIYSIADGFVSRIKVSPSGYGHALYIEHYNGYTSVYAHLNAFEGAIGDYVEQRQYANQNFRIDEKVPPHLLNVTKGQVVALSGNTGSSTAPHLHFEIRDTYTEAAINPLLFGFYVPDAIKPSIRQMALYNFQNGTTPSKPKIYTAKKVNGKYTLSTATIKVSTPTVGLGLKAYDKQSGANNLNGIYSIQVFDNGSPIYYFKVERVPFEETRYLNAHIDYCLRKEGRGWMQKCFIDPGNQLSAYRNVVNRGLINLADGGLHSITFEVKDVAGNISRLSTNLQYIAPSEIVLPPTPSYNQNFSYASDNYFERADVKANFSYGSFYTDVPFTYTAKTPTEKGIYSLYHQLHTGKTPVHKYFDVWVKPLTLPNHLYDKAVIVHQSVTGRKRSLGGDWEGNFLRAKSREFGKFYIKVDDTPPRIKAVNIQNGKVMTKNTQIIMGISDNLSGIASYNAYIDDRWVLMKYDGKSARLRYFFDEQVGKGSHTFRLVVKDGRNNEAIYKAKFIR